MLGRRLLIAAQGGGSFAPSPPYPDSFNDEFDDPDTLTTRWAEDAGDTFYIYKDVDDTVPSALYLQGQVYMIPPEMPFTVETSVTYVDWDSGPGVGGIWINLAAGAPGPYLGFGPDVGIPGRMWLSGSTFDSSGAFITNIYVRDTVYDDSYAVPHHTKLVVHSSSNVDAFVSFDGGASWTTICTGYNPGFTVNYVGLESGGARAGFDWVRYT